MVIFHSYVNVYQRVLPISETPYGFCMGFSPRPVDRRPTPSELIPCLIQGAEDCRVWDRRLSHPSPCRHFRGDFDLPCGSLEVSMGVPQVRWMVGFMENPIRMDDEQGIPPFRKPH